MNRASATRPRIGLALPGSSPLGAIQEIGALCALEEALSGIDFSNCHSHIGVSARGFVAAGLVNGMRHAARELCASFIENVGLADDIFQPSVLMRPAWGEFAKRLASLPGLVTTASLRYAFTRHSLASAIEGLGRALPTGLLSNRMIEVQLRKQFSAPGRSNDFRQLRHKLVLVATDLDSGELAPFGLPGLDHVPISLAVQASSALPGLFPPGEIEGRHGVDGALKKTLHASVLRDEGLDLLICLNPLVSFDATATTRHRVMARSEECIPRLVDGGLPVVLSQTFRTLIHSRLELGMKGYEHSHPGTTILLFEPDQRDPAMFLANTFSYSQRRLVAEHAYRRTRQMLRARRSALNRQLAWHGLQVDDAVLDDAHRRLVRTARPDGRNAGRALCRLEEVLDDLETTLAAWPLQRRPQTPLQPTLRPTLLPR
jgi:NTE family protein